MATIETVQLGDMRFQSTMGSHRLVSDVPPAMGGHDRGPTPPELFVASLGSWVAAFVAQYCMRAGLDARDLGVAVTFDKLEQPTGLGRPAGRPDASRCAAVRMARRRQG